ncbi:phosphoenolpyruvate phosphomutase-like protein [Streptomyces sp. HB202]|nr:phosphoenolpyruvate phosphomutase-like protein [Streptomyces sp. HB202]
MRGSVVVMDFRTTVERAERLKHLHAEHKPLVLPTVWDVWSARTAAAAGFPALTIGSHPLADSRGAEDQEGQTFEEVLAAVRPIIAAVDVPVSVDLESGYGQKPADLVAGLVEAGGVGLNIEDTVHSEGGRVRSTQEHASYVAGLRAAADDAGVPVWVNGRTDLFAHAENPSAVLDEVIERLRALEQAGADSVYPVKIQDNDELLAAVTAGRRRSGEHHGASREARPRALPSPRRRPHHLRSAAAVRADGRDEGHAEAVGALLLEAARRCESPPAAASDRRGRRAAGEKRDQAAVRPSWRPACSRTSSAYRSPLLLTVRRWVA